MQELIISPSILSLDYARVSEQLDTLARSKAAWLHFDVMDGHFVPNLTFGPDILKGFSQAVPQKMDVHIMVEDPQTYADVFMDAGADVLTFHAEALHNDPEAIRSLCAHIRQRGVLAGVSVRPGTPVDFLVPLLQDMDLVLVMSVEPGFGGQSFQPQVLEKVRLLRQRIDALGLTVRIEIDGGINAQTGALAVEAGCDTLGARSYVFTNDSITAVDRLICR